MKEIIAFCSGAVVALIMMKATATIMHLGNQDWVCYVLHNPFN